MSKSLIIVIDGCAVNYINEEHTPYICEIGKRGFLTQVESALPSVTNVNHATILSGGFSEEHGVVGNYYYNKETGEEGFIESSKHMKKESIIDVFHKQGKTTALLTVKGKVLEVFGENVDLGINLQKPQSEILERLGLSNPPGVSTLESSNWIFEACYQVIKNDNPDLVYCTTNDYMMHHFSPYTEEALQVMNEIDNWIGRIYEIDPTREIYITADHGMNTKTRLIDLQKKLDAADFNTYCLLPLKDRYLENHIYQEGGSIYVYAKQEEQLQHIIEYLSKCDFIDGIYTKEEANKAFGLPSDGIGDLFILANKECAFAELEQEELYTTTRTHGSLHEREIPLLALNARREQEAYAYSKDIVRYMLEDILE